MGSDRTDGYLFFACCWAMWFLGVGVATARWPVILCGLVVAIVAFFLRTGRSYRLALTVSLLVSAIAGVLSLSLTKSGSLGKDGGLLVILFPVIAVSFSLWRTIRSHSAKGRDVSSP